MKKALVYTSHGLGDGLIFLMISKNLSKNGYIVDTYHPLLFQLQGWIDYTNLLPYPKNFNNFEFLKQYDLIVINSDYQTLNKELVKYTKENIEDKTFELHPSTCKGKNPPIGDLKFDLEKSILENLKDFCQKSLNLKLVEMSNSLKIPKNLIYRKYPNRVAIHPSSKDIEKNWPKEKFYKLCLYLKKLKFDPYLILTDEEKTNFQELDIPKPSFKNLDGMASFIYESGFLIGNDSGVAHLASSLKIPTLTIFSTKRKEKFWRPNFFISKTVISWPLINIAHLRLREKFWKKTITVKRVLKNFITLVDEYESSNI